MRPVEHETARPCGIDIEKDTGLVVTTRRWVPLHMVPALVAGWEKAAPLWKIRQHTPLGDVQSGDILTGGNIVSRWWAGLF